MEGKKKGRTFGVANLLLYVESSPQSIIVTSSTPQSWIIALIVIASVFLLLALSALFWLWRKRSQKKVLLTEPDALRIAQTFREAMTNSGIADHKEQKAQDLLQRQLQAETGTQVTHIRRFE
ncbi:hypothetical protein BY458DRAFT_444818 [Sporodiniella umbellata]|nr:hypothetical protein BY458DRAFT_444818 [Sporodiniella umbellata]